MKNKTLLSLMAVNAVGCIGSPLPSPYQAQPDLIVQNVYEQNEDEQQVLSRLYDTESQQCYRSHYLEMQADAIKSFLVAEHCVDRPVGSSGALYAVRFADTDANGLADERCTTFATTSVGRQDVQTNDCRKMTREMSLVGLMDYILYDSVSFEPHPLVELTGSLYDN